MGAHIFPFGSQAIQREQGKIRACYLCAAIEGTTRGGCMTWAHNLLSRCKYILYTTQYSNLTSLVERGEAVEAVAVADCCGREQEALYYYSEIQVVYIVII